MDQETRSKPTTKFVLAAGFVALLGVAVFLGWLWGSSNAPVIVVNTAINSGATAASAAAAAIQAHKATEAQKREDKMIFGLLEKSGHFKTLLELLNGTGQAALLKSPGNFTVFAPTDEAFAKFPKEMMEDLRKPENFDNLKSLLGYHLLNGNFILKNVSGKKAAPNSLQGEVLNIDGTGKTVMVENATITSADSEPSNGMIYVVDAVLVPPSLNVAKQ
ncbi:MAG: fasciclin domain-containing protein [Proteobacteria bacterium]|nr:fasciclin domain-containing protein [Pseudomonadota bacterium]